MTRVCTKFMSKLLTEKQKNVHRSRSDKRQMVYDDENVLNKIITIDEL